MGEVKEFSRLKIDHISNDVEVFGQFRSSVSSRIIDDPISISNIIGFDNQIRSQMPVVFEKTQSFAREYQWSLYISGEHVLAGFVMQYNYSSSNRAFTRDISLAIRAMKFNI